MDGKIALYRECSFPKCAKLHHLIKATLVDFRGSIVPLWIRPCA